MMQIRSLGSNRRWINQPLTAARHLTALSSSTKQPLLAGASHRRPTKPMHLPRRSHLGLSLHHIISKQTLYDTYEKIIQEQDQELGSAFLNLLNISSSNFVKDLNSDAWKSKAEYTWAEWNLVEGPSPMHRQDDPGSQLDDFSHSVYGKTLQRRCETIVQLEKQFHGYLNNSSPRDELLTALTSVAPRLKYKHYIPYADVRWEADDQGFHKGDLISA